jgi:hypothetical protein
LNESGVSTHTVRELPPPSCLRCVRVSRPPGNNDKLICRFEKYLKGIFSKQKNHGVRRAKRFLCVSFDVLKMIQGILRLSKFTDVVGNHFS